MKEVILLYSCDAWHSHDSMELAGIFTCPEYLRAYLIKMKLWCRITQKACDELLETGQTQGLETNYFIQSKPLNPRFKPF